MAELADALASGANDRKVLEVQILSGAHSEVQKIKIKLMMKTMTARKHSQQNRIRFYRRDDRGLAHKTEMKNTASAKSGVLRIVPLGGFEEVGRNMMFLEYGDEIIIVDMGLQFPEAETPGVDYIIPNTAYLEANKKRIKGVIITHGHYDHIGAIPHIMPLIGNPPIYTAALSRALILKRQEDFLGSPKLNIKIVGDRDFAQMSKHFKVRFFELLHNVPDTIGALIETPVGKILHTAEFKFEHNENGQPQGIELFEKLSREGIDLMLLDSTGAEQPGRSVPEKLVEKNLLELFKSAKGRIIVGAFASLLDRISTIMKIAEDLNRHVAISGYSMKTNIQLYQELGYMKLKRDTIVPIEDIDNYHDNQLLLLCTGSQGEPNASLMRIANGEHKHIKVRKGDSIVLSSSVIPGNERGVQILKDNLSRQGATVYHYKMLDIHSSGHMPSEDLRLVIRTVKPKYFVPMHGYYYMRKVNGEHAKSVGIADENVIIADNGSVIELSKEGIRLTDEKIPSFYVMVDGLGVGDVGEIVLRDRRALAQDGMFVIITTLDKETGKLLKNPDIISRGFVYLKESSELIEATRKKVKHLINDIPTHQTIDPDYVKNLIRDEVGAYLFEKTHRRPMILPVVIEV